MGIQATFYKGEHGNEKKRQRWLPLLMRENVLLFIKQVKNANLESPVG